MTGTKGALATAILVAGFVGGFGGAADDAICLDSYFGVASFSGCSGTNSNDDTVCILNAIAAAASAGGGNVTIGSRYTTWRYWTSCPRFADPNGERRSR